MLAQIAFLCAVYAGTNTGLDDLVLIEPLSVQNLSRHRLVMEDLLGHA